MVTPPGYGVCRAWTGPSGGSGEKTGRTAEKILRLTHAEKLSSSAVREVTPTLSSRACRRQQYDTVTTVGPPPVNPAAVPLVICRKSADYGVIPAAVQAAVPTAVQRAEALMNLSLMTVDAMLAALTQTGVSSEAG
jgi:hypothetical protein